MSDYRIIDGSISTVISSLQDRSLRARRAAAAQNGYGDEPITPAGNPYAEDDYEEGTTTTSTTTAPTTTKKAQNGYGDEAVSILLQMSI